MTDLTAKWSIKRRAKQTMLKSLILVGVLKALAVNSGVCGDRHGEFVAITRNETRI